MTEPIPQEISSAVEALFRATADDLYRYASTLPLEDNLRPDDLVQETFHAALLAWRKSGLEVRDLAGQRRWLFRVLRNKAVDQWRAGKRIVLGYEMGEADPQPTRDATYSQAVSSVVLERCWSEIAKMPLQMQRVAFLLWNEDWPTDRIAAWLGIQQSTVWSHVSHIRKQLVNELGTELTSLEEMTERVGRREQRLGGELS